VSVNNDTKLDPLLVSIMIQRIPFVSINNDTKNTNGASVDFTIGKTASSTVLFNAALKLEN
jgi:hypothetical protein